MSESKATLPRQTRQRGFTFVEILAAMLFMAIVIPVTVEGIMIANRAGVAAERKRVAAGLADMLLTEKVVTEEWRDGEQQGDFGEDWPEYNWVLRNETWEEEGMRLISVEVQFLVQGRDYSVSLSTLVEEEEAAAA